MYQNNVFEEKRYSLFFLVDENLTLVFERKILSMLQEVKSWRTNKN